MNLGITWGADGRFVQTNFDVTSGVDRRRFRRRLPVPGQAGRVWDADKSGQSRIVRAGGVGVAEQVAKPVEVVADAARGVSAADVWVERDASVSVGGEPVGEEHQHFGEFGVVAVVVGHGTTMRSMWGVRWPGQPVPADLARFWLPSVGGVYPRIVKTVRRYRNIGVRPGPFASRQF